MPIRILALGLATAALRILSRPIRGGHDPATRLFDAPGAAARYAQGRRAPIRDDVNIAVAYQRASLQRDRMPRFSFRISLALPAALPAARVWTSGSRSVALDGPSSPTALLDAWTPLGPGNIGGRTRVVRYHPTRHATIFAIRSPSSGTMAVWRGRRMPAVVFRPDHARPVRRHAPLSKVGGSRSIATTE